MKRLAALLFCTAALAAPAAFAGGHGHGGFRGGGFHHSPGFHHPGGFPRHHFHSSFVFVGPPAFFYGPPYPYYGSPYVAVPAAPPPPPVYIERFDGIPSPGMTGIYCPSSGQYYPQTTACPGGWAHIIQNPDVPPAG